MYVFFEVSISLIKKFSGSMKVLKTPRRYSQRTPYWNFWKVVFAGWLIRYPGKMLRIFGVPLGFLIVMIYNAITK
jgi:hypothetical protein